MNRLPQLLAAVGLLVAAILMLINLGTIARDPGAFVDARILFPIIESWWNEEAGLYPSTVEAQREPGVASYRYPPVWAVSVLPLVLPFELSTTILLWGAVSLAVFLLGIGLVARHLGIEPTSPGAALLLFVLALFGPLYETFYGPTKELMMVGLTALAYVLLERGRVLSAGLAYAGAIVHKIYPLLFGYVFFVRRQWRMLLATIGGLVVLNVLPMVLIGWRDTVDFYLHILPFLGGSSPSPENAGIEQLMMVLAWRSWFDHGTAPLDYTAFSGAVVTAIRLGILIAFTALAWALDRRQAFDERLTRYLLFATWITAVIVIIPVSWVNYQIWFVFPLIGIFAWLSRQRPAVESLVVAVALVTALLVMSTPFKLWGLESYGHPEMGRSLQLASTVGIELFEELGRRVDDRQRRLEALRRGGTSLDDVQLDEARRTELRLPGSSDRATDHAVVERQLQALESMGPAAATPDNLARVRHRVRVTRLTTGQLLGWMLVRPLAGAAILLAVGLAAASSLGNRREV